MAPVRAILGSLTNSFACPIYIALFYLEYKKNRDEQIDKLKNLYFWRTSYFPKNIALTSIRYARLKYSLYLNVLYQIFLNWSEVT